ncbi:MAG: hypothetical protein CFH31_00563 [Alphaproteobacteria bacterium MarineAlpha9_Bin1]|nr:MAG: hypothetical protein CFH31_00563 [Alphaproteobacteria bacterium MarineAlpha9_Bin1]
MIKLLFKLLSLLLVVVFFNIFMVDFKLYAEEQIPDFPYDPEEIATEIKMCARSCLRRKDICFNREDHTEEYQQICQSQFIICINQCR